MCGSPESISAMAPIMISVVVTPMLWLDEVTAISIVIPAERGARDAGIQGHKDQPLPHLTLGPGSRAGAVPETARNDIGPRLPGMTLGDEHPNAHAGTLSCTTSAAQRAKPSAVRAAFT